MTVPKKCSEKLWRIQYTLVALLDRFFFPTHTDCVGAVHVLAGDFGPLEEVAAASDVGSRVAVLQRRALHRPAEGGGGCGGKGAIGLRGT